MQQRQRLKNLDRFKAVPRGQRAIIVSTDVAARGLDIPKVDFVVHYQLPLTTEVYVNRCGRTARAGESGLSCALVGADDHKNYKKICQLLNKPAEEGLTLLEFDLDLMPAIRDRLELARMIDSESHTVKATQHHNDWFVRTAHTLDIELDDSMKRQLFRDDTADMEDSKGAAMKGKRRTGSIAEETGPNASGSRKAKRAAARDREPYIPVFETLTNSDDIPDGDETDNTANGDGEEAEGGDDSTAPAAGDNKRTRRLKAKLARKQRDAALAQQLKAGQELTAVQRSNRHQLESLKRQLHAALAQPLISKSINRNYFTLNTIDARDVTTSTNAPVTITRPVPQKPALAAAPNPAAVKANATTAAATITTPAATTTPTTIATAATTIPTAVVKTNKAKAPSKPAQSLLKGGALDLSTLRRKTLHSSSN